LGLVLLLLANAMPIARSAFSVRTRTSGHLRTIAVPMLGAGTCAKACPR